MGEDGTTRQLRRPVLLRVAIVTAVVAAALVAAASTVEGEQTADAPASRRSAAPRALEVEAASARPTPGVDSSAVPLGRPSPPPPERGRYRFVATQPGSDEPITYDPCRPIKVVVNVRTMPKGAADVVEEALATMTAVTGFRFELEGTTDEEPDGERPSYQPERYGDRWAPLLIAWSDELEDEGLRGAVSGRAGSRFVHDAFSDRWVYVTGMITLDGPDLASLAKFKRGIDHVRGLLLHELAHVVGLDHVDDPEQLMHPQGQIGVTTFGPGDLHGLAIVSSGPCVPGV